MGHSYARAVNRIPEIQALSRALEALKADGAGEAQGASTGRGINTGWWGLQSGMSTRNKKEKVR
jgi:hypothetical protein